VLSGDVTVVAGATLTVEAGVVVKVAAGDAAGAGLDAARTELKVVGTIRVLGTAAQPVTFQAASGSLRNAWYGLIVDAGAQQAELRYVTFRNASVAVLTYAPGTVLTAEKLTFNNNVYGMFYNNGTSSITGITATGNDYGMIIDGGEPVIDQVVASANGVGIHFQRIGAGTVSNAHLYSNTTVGLQASLNAGIVATVKHATINNNGAGAGTAGVVGSGSGVLQLYNSVVSANGQYGINRTGGSMNLGNNNVFGNSVNYQGVVAGAGSISANPLLAGIGDPHLGSASPCIDAGTTTQSTVRDLYGQLRTDGNGDGTVLPDIGAAEYVCGSPVVITGQPQAASAVVGGPFLLGVTATGAGATYQWRKGGVNVVNGRGIVGATEPVLSVSLAGMWDAGTYDVVVTNACGSVTSNGAVVTVTAAGTCGTADFNGDGDVGTDADIEAFFRVLAGGNC
jgi:hypothetical protein